MKIARIFVFSFLFFGGYCNSYASNDVYDKLFAELKKYAIVRDHYSDTDLPILTGNTAMGGLTDPLGRGLYNIEMNDLYLNNTDRIAGPGMMLKMAKFSGLLPDAYRQSYDLETGILNTHVAYADGAYDSELFFSQDDKELMVYTLTNLGQKNLLCNIDLGPFEFNVAGHSKNTVYCISKEPSFTYLHYFLQTNLSLGSSLPYSKDIFLNIPPGKKLEIIVRMKVEPKSIPQLLSVPSETSELLKNNVRKWQENWQSMGFVILPEGDYARAFYRSLHWLQCTAGLESNLPGESQFATISSNMAVAYNYHGNAHLNRSPWGQEPFTYGGTGWAIWAYTWFGDKTRAGNMLAGLYRPEALKKNVTDMFPVGMYEFEYGGKKKGRFEYLSPDHSNAISFAHENLYDRSNRQATPWDKQIQIQGFAPAMYYQYNRLFAEKEDTVYAVVKGSAELWRSMLHYDPAQKSYTLPPLLSLTEDLFEAGVIDGLLAAKWTLTQAAALSQKRNTDPDLRAKWLQIANQIRVKDKDDVYLEFTNDDGSRSGAGYQGIRGYCYLGFPTLELMKGFSGKKVNKSLDQCWIRNKKGNGMITFVANWFALTDAYWGRAEEAYEKSCYALSQTEPSASAMCEQNGHLYYFLTGYASFTIVPVAMALQTVGDEIKVFPAVPKAFGDIEFYNLPAMNNIRVSGIMKGGKTQQVWFEKDGKTLLEVSGKDGVSAKWVKDKLVLNK
jgi:hypothetical protein